MLWDPGCLLASAETPWVTFSLSFPAFLSSFRDIYSDKPPGVSCPSWASFWEFPVGQGFPSGSVSKESACNARGLSLIPGSGRSPGEGNGNPLQYSCLGNPMDRGAWQVTVHGVARVRCNIATKPPPPIGQSKSICLALGPAEIQMGTMIELGVLLFSG